MKALDKVLRGLAVVALVVAGVALWRAESRASSSPTRAASTPDTVVVTGAAAPTRTAMATTTRALPIDQGLAPAVPAGRTRTVAPRPTPTERGELTVARLLVARQVRDREPVDPASSFELSRGDALYAFVDVRGATTERTLHVQFVPDDGAPVGLVDLAVAPTARYRTWAFTRGVRRSGHWSVVVSDEQGRALAQTDFDVTMVTEHAAPSGASAASS